MTEKESNRVDISWDKVLYWSFMIGITPTTVKEQNNITVSLTRSLCDSFDSFLLPMKIKSGWTLHPPGAQISHDRPDQEEIVNITIEGKKGLTPDQIVTVYESSSSPVKYSRGIPFKHNKVKVWIDGNERYIDRGSEIVDDDSVDDTSNMPDPVTVVTSFFPNRHQETIDAEYLWSARVNVHSDLYVEDSERGSRNRDYLQQFLERINSTLPIDDIDREDEIDGAVSQQSIF